MQYIIKYTIKAEVFDLKENKKIYFTEEDQITIDKIPEMIFDNNHLIDSGSIYDYLDNQIEMYAKKNGNSIDDYRIDFFEVFTNSDEYEVFFAHPENKNEFTLTPDLYALIYKPEVTMLDTPVLKGELLTNTSIKWSFDIPEGYKTICGHYIYDENEEVITQLPIGVDYFIETELDPLTNYTRKVKRYTNNLESDFSFPVTISTKIEDIDNGIDKLKPFKKDWYNETDFEEMNFNRLKAFESGIGGSDDLKLLDLNINKFNKDIGVVYKYSGTKNKLKFEDVSMEMSINIINNHTEVKKQAIHSDGGINTTTVTGCDATLFFTKTVNGYKEETASLGHRRINFYNSDAIEDFKLTIKRRFKAYAVEGSSVDVGPSYEYNQIQYDSVNFDFNMEDTSKSEEPLELYYRDSNNNDIPLNYKEKENDKTFEMFIKDKVVAGIIPIESDILQAYFDMGEEYNFNRKYWFEDILELINSLHIGYEKQVMIKLDQWESEEIKADNIHVDLDTETIQYDVKNLKLVAYNLKMNEVIKPLYITKYIDNQNFRLDSFEKRSISFNEEEITRTIVEKFSFQKTINPMNPVLNKGLYYLNNLEMYKYNDSNLKINEYIETFKTKKISSLIKYELIIENNKYEYEFVTVGEVKYNDEVQSISGNNTIRRLIEDNISSLENTSYDSIELISVECLEDEVIINEVSLDTGINIKPRIIADTYSYNNIIELEDNKYIIDSFNGIEQEKIILKKGFYPLERVFNKEDEKSLSFNYHKKGTNQRIYKLPHINIDKETFNIKVNNEPIEYELFNNNIILKRNITEDEIIEVSYKIKDSFIIYEEEDHHVIEVNTTIEDTDDFILYHEVSKEPIAIDDVYLNPLFSGITEGYLYVDDKEEDIKRLELKINDSNVNFNNKEITFGKIIAIDEFGNRCPNIKVYAQAEKGELEYLKGDITNENGIVTYLYRPPNEICEDSIIVTHPDIKEIKKVIINVQ